MTIRTAVSVVAAGAIVAILSFPSAAAFADSDPVPVAPAAGSVAADADPVPPPPLGDPVPPPPLGDPVPPPPLGDPVPPPPAGDPVPAPATTLGPVGLTLVATPRVTDTNRNGRKDTNDTIAFHYVLRNSGSVLTQRLTVSDRTVTVVCRRSSLAAGSATVCDGSRKVTLADMNRGAIVSAAVAKGVAIDGRAVKGAARGVSVAMSVVTRLVVQQRIVRLVDVNRDGRIGAGDRITYGFTVSNSGNVAVSKVAVRDALLVRSSLNVICRATFLKPGASTTCTAQTYTVTVGDVRRGKVQNFAAATAQAPSGATVRSNSRVTVQPVAGRVTVARPQPKLPRVPRPRITLSQWIVRIDDNNHNTLVDARDGVVYGFRVTNSGGTPVTRIVIDAARLARSGVGVSCSSKTLMPGSSVTCASGVYTATARSMTHGVGSNFASATAVSASGKVIRSNSTVITLPVGASAGPAGSAGFFLGPSTLAMTGSPAERLLQWAGGLIAAGFVLRRVSRERNSATR